METKTVKFARSGVQLADYKCTLIRDKSHFCFLLIVAEHASGVGRTAGLQDRWLRIIIYFLLVFFFHIIFVVFNSNRRSGLNQHECHRINIVFIIHITSLS